jgi:hypothetical protein
VVGYRAAIATVNVEAVIYMAAKVSMAVKPWAGTDEDAAVKPFRAVVAVGSTGVRSEVIIPIGACGFGSEIDVDLSLCFGSIRDETNTGDSSSKSVIESVHKILFNPSGDRGESLYV